MSNALPVIMALTTGLAIIHASGSSHATAPKKATSAQTPKTMSDKQITKTLNASTKCPQLHPAQCPEIRTLIQLGPGLEAQLQKQLSSAKSDRLMASVLTVAGALKLKSFGPVVKTFVKSPDKRLCYAAVTALGNIDVPERVPLLTEVMNSQLINDKLVAINALGNTGEHKALSPLVRSMSHHHPRVQSTAVHALATLGHASALKPLTAIFANPRSGRLIRVAAAKALGRIGNQTTVPMLIFALGDPDPKVNEAVINALETLKDPRSIVPLGLLLRNETTAPAAAAALGRMKQREAIPALVRALRERRHDPKALESVYMALGSIGAKESVSAITPSLKDPDPEVVCWAALALGAIGVTTANPPLIEALASENKKIKDHVHAALKEINRHDVGTDPVAWTTWLEPQE